MAPKEVPPFARQRNRWEDERLGSLKGTRLSCLRTQRKEMKEMGKPFPLGRKTYMTKGIVIEFCHRSKLLPQDSQSFSVSPRHFQ